MKIIMHKNGMSRPALPEDVERFELAGWSKEPAQQNVIKVEEQIVLKPPVKSKSTAKTLDNANQQGEE